MFKDNTVWRHRVRAQLQSSSEDVARIPVVVSVEWASPLKTTVSSSGHELADPGLSCTIDTLPSARGPNGLSFT